MAIGEARLKAHICTAVAVLPSAQAIRPPTAQPTGICSALKAARDPCVLFASPDTLVLLSSASE